MRARITTTREVTAPRQIRAEGMLGDAIQRQHVTFWCNQDHATVMAFAVDALVNPAQSCRYCGRPAGTDRTNPPSPAHYVPVRSHEEYVFERRSPEQREMLLAEAVTELHAKRAAGLVT